MTQLDPNMLTFLRDHPMARSVVYGMMRNAATTHDDPKMVEWYAPVQEAVDKAVPMNQRDVERREFCKLTRGMA